MNLFFGNLAFEPKPRRQILIVARIPRRLGLKAYLLAETGKKAEAIAAAEKAIQLAKTTTPPGNTAELEKRLAEWKTAK